MFGGSIRLFNFRGVPVTISIFGLLLIVLFWVLPTASNQSYAQVGANSLLIGVGIGVGLVISIIIHELSHAITGMLFKARVTAIELNVLGGATYFDSKPKSYYLDALLSLAGPASNFVLWFVLKLAYQGIENSVRQGSGSIELYIILGQLSFINLFLGIFNALPGFPLDGGQAVHSFVMGITRNSRFSAGLTMVTGLSVVAYLGYNALRGGNFGGVGTFFILYILFWIGSSSVALWQQAGKPVKIPPTPRQQAERQQKESEDRAKSHPGQIPFQQGRDQLLSRDYTGAINSFNQAIQLEPREMSYLDYRAYAFAQMGNYGQAITDYNELLEKNPNRADFFAARANAYKSLGNFEAARYDVEKALSINPMEGQAMQLQSELNKQVR